MKQERQHQLGTEILNSETKIHKDHQEKYKYRNGNVYLLKVSTMNSRSL